MPMPPNNGLQNPMPKKKLKVKVFKRDINFSGQRALVFALIFGLAGGYILWRSFAATGTIAQFTTSAPVIDGNLKEASWSLSSTIAKTVLGSPNNTATFGTQWDNNYLYVGVKVLDHNLYKDSVHPWDDDSVEVYVDPNHSRSTTYNASDRQFNLRYNDPTLVEEHGYTAGVLHAVAPINGGYSVELAIPWTNLGIAPSANAILGFDVGYNDDDNGGLRDGQAMWHGTANNFHDTSAFGDLQLVKPAPAANTYVSDLPFTKVANGYGPMEKDKSNGGQAAGDGRTLTLNGQTYTKGLGVHAPSEVDVTLNGQYQSFVSDVGVDDEACTAGTVDFQVFADNAKLFDSGVMNGSSATQNVNVSVIGKSQLKLIVTNGGDTNTCDHGDWAGAKLTGLGTPPPPPPPPPPLPPPPPAASAYSNFVGLNAYVNNDDSIAANTIGVHRIRRDHPDAAVFTVAKASGVSVLPVLDYEPWPDLNGDKGDIYPPLPQYYSTWASRQLNDLKNALASAGVGPPEAIEVWNEPWLASFWQPMPDPTGYFNLFKATAQQAWAIWPNVKVLISADTTGSTNTSGTLYWRQNVLAADITGFLNDPRVLPTTHPYVEDRTPTTVTGQPCWWDLNRFKCAYNDFKAHGHPNPQVWITEFGWESNLVGEANQAAYTKQALQMFHDSGMVAEAYAFHIKSNDTWDYDWLNTSNVCKPVCGTVKTLITTGQ